jgi:3D (Asp-Asp-Asp) domain-containing protein/peptidoglycan/xylan/chitin deacetylase (PgdA/CDA1 family)
LYLRTLTDITSCDIFTFAKNYWFALIIIIIIANFFATSASITLGQEGGNKSDILCERCIIFRLDDVQDYSFQPGALAVMDLFLSKGIKLSLGLVMNDIGNDSRIIEKVKEGSETGLFELALHAWNHVDYTTLTYEEQRNSLQMANEKMAGLFGNKSDIFLPPYGEFNNATIDATKNESIRILGSVYDDEFRYDQGKSIFISNGTDYDDIGKPVLYHVPATTLYKNLLANSWQTIPNEQLLQSIENDIKKFGYSVFTLHPQELMLIENGSVGSTLNEDELRSFSDLIDSILLKNVTATTHSELVGLPSKCSSGWNITGYFTPVENDYSGELETVLVGDEKVSRTFYKSFLDDVSIEATGKTREGDYLATYDAGETYVSHSDPLSAQGTKLEIGDIATDPSVIPTGTDHVMIPTLTPPWNNYFFAATDTGGVIKGQHVDVYTGEGKAAEQETFRITSSNNEVCY